METYRNEEMMRKMMAEFEKTDAFYAIFKKEYIYAVKQIAKAIYYPVYKVIDLSKILEIHAQEVLNATQSVLDKDHNYPEYRMEEELDWTRVVLKSMPEYTKIELEFCDQVHLKTKELIVKYFEDIMSLSSNGFKLLEINSKVHNYRLMNTLFGALDRQMPE